MASQTSFLRLERHFVRDSWPKVLQSFRAKDFFFLLGGGGGGGWG